MRKNWSKKVVSLALAGALLFVIAVGGQLAKADSENIAKANAGSITWSLSEAGVLTISGYGEMKDFAYEGSPWNAQRESITEVQFDETGEGIQNIGKYAFYGCANLRSITIPDNMLSIGASAFAYCTSLQAISIPQSVITLGSSAFTDCTKLQAVSLLCQVATISTTTFCNCSSLESIELPESVMKINDNAFSGCENLSKIYLPASLTTIGTTIFASCAPMTVYYGGDDEPDGSWKFASSDFGAEIQQVIFNQSGLPSASPSPTEKPSDPSSADAQFGSTSISLQENTILNQYLELPEGKTPADYTVRVRIENGQSQEARTAAIETLSENGETRYRVRCAASAAEMTCKMHFSLLRNADGEEVDSFSASVQDYCAALLKSEAGEDWGNLITALLNYGTEAQKKFCVNRDQPANSILKG